ncbi:hypothetical protein D3C72_1741900 [compost metagenome]
MLHGLTHRRYSQLMVRSCGHQPRQQHAEHHAQEEGRPDCESRAVHDGLDSLPVQDADNGQPDHRAQRTHHQVRAHRGARDGVVLGLQLAAEVRFVWMHQPHLPAPEMGLMADPFGGVVGCRPGIKQCCDLGTGLLSVQGITGHGLLLLGPRAAVR